MRAVTVRLPGLSLQSPTGTPSRMTDPPESPALPQGGSLSLYFQCQFEPEVILLAECFTASYSVPD